MEQGNSSVREKLLAHLPQPENLAAYREETATLMARHERALFWDKMPSLVFTLMAVGFFLITNFTIRGSYDWGPIFDPKKYPGFQIFAGLAFLIGSFEGLRHHIYKSKVDLLKELKQVQLQVLELQASLRKTGE